MNVPWWCGVAPREFHSLPLFLPHHMQSKEETFLVEKISSNACFVVSKSYWYVSEGVRMPCS